MKRSTQPPTQAPVNPSATPKAGDAGENRNTTTSEPVDKKELRENLSGADSSLEKPRDQDA